MTALQKNERRARWHVRRLNAAGYAVLSWSYDEFSWAVQWTTPGVRQRRLYWWTRLARWLKGE